MPLADSDLSLLPPSLQEEIDAETRYLYPAELLSHLRPSMRDWSADAIFDHLLAGTAFARLRMEWRFGPITAIQCRAHPGHVYYAFVPLQLLLRKADSAPLIVSVHGSSRNAREFREHFSRLAQARDAVVLAPLFAMDLDAPIPDQSYTTLASHGPRADEVLIDLIDELSALLSVRFSCTVMFGFSGGAQFAHRFCYLHPDRVQAVSLGAPGFVTLPVRSKNWWVGVGDMPRRFGRRYDPLALRRIAVHTLIGAEDHRPAHVWSLAEMGLSSREYERYGHTRMERLHSLTEAWRHEGVNVEHEVLDGVGHVAPGPVVEAANRFLDRQLQRLA